MAKVLESNKTLVNPTALKSFCTEAMLRSGMSEPDARVTAEVLVTNDMWGIFTHGTKHLVTYLKRIRAGGIDPTAVPEVIAEGPSWAIMDAKLAMAMVSSCRAMNLAISKARSTGVAYVGVRNSTHFGAASYYANMAAENDMIGLAMSNVDANMTAPGAKGSVIGNNPIACAVPAGDEMPILLDIAMSTVAAGKVFAAQALGERAPGNWISDHEGIPTSDISSYPRVGSLLPMGGHKGYGLAVIIEVLASVLTGAMMTADVKSWVLDLDKPTGEGHAFIAIDIGAMMPIEQFRERMDRMIRGIKSAPSARGASRVCLPGELEWKRHDEALRNGIQMPEDVINNLVALARLVGMDPESFVSAPTL